MHFSSLKNQLMIVALSVVGIVGIMYGVSSLSLAQSEQAVGAGEVANTSDLEVKDQRSEPAHPLAKPAFLRVVPAQSIVHGILLGAFKSDLPGVTDGNSLPYRRYAAVGIFDMGCDLGEASVCLAQNKPAPMPYGGFAMPNKPYQPRPQSYSTAPDNNPVYTGTGNTNVTNGPQFGWQQQMQALPYGVNDMVIESFNGNPNVVDNLMRIDVNQVLHDQINQSLQQ